MSDWGWIVAGGVGGLVLLHRMLIWCEAKGWVYYRNAPRGASAAAGGVFGDLMEVLHPSRQITVQETLRQRERVQRVESGAGGVDINMDVEHLTIVFPSAEGGALAPETAAPGAGENPTGK
jgi:hypothetical protein